MDILRSEIGTLEIAGMEDIGSACSFYVCIFRFILVENNILNLSVLVYVSHTSAMDHEISYRSEDDRMKIV